MPMQPLKAFLAYRNQNVYGKTLVYFEMTHGAIFLNTPSCATTENEKHRNKDMLPPTLFEQHNREV